MARKIGGQSQEGSTVEILVSTMPPLGDAERPLAVRSVERTLASRYSTYIDEVTRLIRAAVAVMDRQQTTNPKVSDIVREAGLSNQAFYKHFRSKSELFLAILDDGQRELVTYLQHQTDKSDTGVGKVRNWVAGMMSQAVVPGAASATRGVMINSLELRVEYPEECERMNRLVAEPLVGGIRLAQEQGTVGPIDPELAAMTIFRLVGSTMEMHVLSRVIPSEDEIDFLVDFILSALGDEPGSAERGRQVTADRADRATGGKRARPAV
jgi:AcrR family transcriptional regulator